MDFMAELEKIQEEMESGEMTYSFDPAMLDFWLDITNHPLPPSSPVPAELELNTSPQSAASQGEEYRDFDAALSDFLAALPDLPSSPPSPVPAVLELNTSPQPAESQGGGYGAFEEDIVDFSLDVEEILEEMELEEMTSALDIAIRDLLTPDHPSPPPPVPAELELDTSPQPAASQGGGYGGCTPQGAAPHMTAAPNMNYGACQQDTVQPDPLYGQPGASSQGQYNNVPVRFLCPIGVRNGQVLYKLSPGPLPPPVSAAPPLNTSNSKKRKRESHQDDDRPYVKRPPNAFMLFMKEQRANVEPELNKRGSAAVNAALGQKWKSLTKEEQANYYDQAEEERRLHAQRHPEWSTRDNYGKKRKRKRTKASTRTSPEDSRSAAATHRLL